MKRVNVLLRRLLRSEWDRLKNSAKRAFLCSKQASFISGQNLQLDGGSYAGLI